MATRELGEMSGLLPHEILLLIARGELKLRDVVTRDGETIEVYRLPTADEQIRAAIAAAPFYAPRFAAEAVVVGSSAQDTINELMDAVTNSPTNRARPALHSQGAHTSPTYLRQGPSGPIEGVSPTAA